MYDNFTQIICNFGKFTQMKDTFFISYTFLCSYINHQKYSVLTSTSPKILENHLNVDNFNSDIL